MRVACASSIKAMPPFVHAMLDEKIVFGASESIEMALPIPRTSYFVLDIQIIRVRDKG